MIRLFPPRIQSKIPQRLNAGEHKIQLDFIDDQSIKQSTVWLDQEKIGWSGTKTSWTLPIQLTSGSHFIKVDVEDNQGLVTRSFYPILVPQTSTSF